MKKLWVDVVTWSIIMVAIVGAFIGWYVISDNSYCRTHEKANPDINFEWNFSDGCMIELPDGTSINLRDYKNRDEFKIEIEK